MSPGLAALLDDTGSTRERCSRAGCSAEAVAELQWRNPKLHAPERRKTWLACPEHTEFLRDFLASRSFPVEVVPHVAGDAVIS